MMMLSNPDPKIFENDAQQLRDCLKGKQDKEEGINSNGKGKQTVAR